MAQQQQDERGAKAARAGFAEGALIALVAALAVRFLRGGPEAIYREWPGIIALTLGAGVIFAIGRGITGRVAGAVVGGVLGIFVGGYLSTGLPQWNVPYRDERPRGEPFALAGPGLEGKRIDVSDYRGKVVLVDFWATWCGPCIAELPGIQEAYEKYHDQGFEIIGVSLDENRGPLEEFVEKRNLPWPQIFFEEDGKRRWKNPLVEEFNIKGIPATFLLDREGRLVARDLRGAELWAAIGRLVEGHPLVGVVPMTRYLGMGTGAILFALAGAFLQRNLRTQEALPPPPAAP